MITAICILSGLCVYEAYVIIVLLAARQEEKKFNEDIDLIDIVAYEKNWRDIHDGS